VSVVGVKKCPWISGHVSFCSVLRDGRARRLTFRPLSSLGRPPHAAGVVNNNSIIIDERIIILYYLRGSQCQTNFSVYPERCPPIVLRRPWAWTAEDKPERLAEIIAQPSSGKSKSKFRAHPTPPANAILLSAAVNPIAG